LVWLWFSFFVVVPLLQALVCVYLYKAGLLVVCIYI
jgi:hypothetical protein